ncbi:Sugar or nucleoside kinase, ribokinase family [Halopenitus malekzadehii]|uniref:Sugar or nucleoside kinase, ribokinase family n=2 Tax=Halopenitus malekzadehii TaxID=1267564 RepID=A0A1H6HS56_9EURY|nr:Sugar or nucleoside kinase, ribokinase family [Halopenitus malekzadehii]
MTASIGSTQVVVSRTDGRMDRRPSPASVYADLRDRLRDGPSDVSITSLPDGSIDVRCRVEFGSGGVVRSRKRFGEAIASGAHKSARLIPTARDSGGQAVNLAIGADALGAEVCLLGHLDADELSSFPFPTYSFGKPATVRLLEFADETVMLAEETPTLRSWGRTDLSAAVEAMDEPLCADVVCWGNWVSVPGTTAMLRHVAERRDSVPGIVLVDPGDLVDSDPDAIRDLFDALSALESVADVVFNANRREIRACTSVLDPPVKPPGDEPRADPESVEISTADDDTRLRSLRAAVGLSGVVMHAADRSAMATADRDAVVSVRNLETTSPIRWTGGGDRFGAGLAVGLGAGWPAETALACGNTAASYYLTHDRTGDAADLANFIEETIDESDRSDSHDDVDRR